MPANNYISVIEKTVRVMEAFRGEKAVALRDLASRTRLVKSSAFRILYTLERLGYVEKQAGGRYSLTTRLESLAGGNSAAAELGNLAAPLMADLLHRFGETVNLAVLDNGEALYIRVQESRHVLRLAAHAGMRSAVHSTSLGKCLLSRLARPEIEAILKNHPLRPITSRTIHDRASLYRELKTVRARGYAIDNEEDSSGVRCVGAPMLDEKGCVRAAMSISGPATRVSPGRDRELAKALLDACSQIAKLMTYSGRTLARGGWQG